MTDTRQDMTSHPSTWEAEAKALRADNERLRDALMFYANPAVYDIPDNGYELVCADAGEIARAALKAGE